MAEIRNKAFRRFQREKKIKKYSRLCKATWYFDSSYQKTRESLGTDTVRYKNFGKGAEARAKYEEIMPKILARTHTLCSSFIDQKSEDFCGPSHSTKKRMQNLEDPRDYEDI